MAFNPDGTALIVGGDYLSFFDPVKGDVIHEEKLASPIMAPFSLSKDGKTLALVQKTAALILDLPVRKIPLQSKTGYADAAALSPMARPWSIPPTRPCTSTIAAAARPKPAFRAATTDSSFPRMAAI